MTPPKRNGERNDAEPIADCRLRIQRQLPIGDWRLEIRSTRVPQSPIRNRQSPIEKSPIRNPQSAIERSPMERSKPMARKKRKHSNDVVRLPVSDGGTTLVDGDIAEKLAGSHLWPTGRGYVQVWRDGRTQSLHRVVCPCPPGKEVDHINGDKRDNRRCNLRAVTPSRNHINTTIVRASSGWRGVHLQGGGVCVHVRWHGLRWARGPFASRLIAACFRDDLARRVRGCSDGANFRGVIKRGDLRGFLQATGGRLFSVVFVRRADGKTRRMVCRLGVTKDQKGQSLRFDPSDRDLLSVYDVQKRQYRFIPLENVLCVTYRGKRFRVLTRAFSIAA